MSWARCGAWARTDDSASINNKAARPDRRMGVHLGASCRLRPGADRQAASGKKGWSCRALAEMGLAQAGQAQERRAGLAVAVEQTAVRELVRLGVGQVDPLHALHERLAQGQSAERSGPLGLDAVVETVMPAARV